MTLLERLRQLATALPPGSSVSLPRDWLLAELEGEPASVQASATPNGSKTPDRLLTAEQVAERLATTPAWVLAHWKQELPFGRKLGRRTLRFSERALERHLARTPQRGTT